MCVCVTRGTGPELVQLIKVVEEDMEQKVVEGVGHSNIFPIREKNPEVCRTIENRS